MTNEQLFWKRFQENEAKYFFLNQIEDKNERGRILNILLHHLHQYCDQLFFEIGGYLDKQQDLIITAEGNSNFFDKVEDLVREAPVLKHWNIVAFKPPVTNVIIEYNNIKLDPNTMYFLPLQNETSQKIGLRIYIPFYNSTYENDFLSATYLVLDNILGERSNALNIGYVEIEALASVSEKQELIELSKLPRYIDWKKSKFNS